MVYPSDRRKEEFLQRYIDRGSPSGFVKLIENKWEEWLKECEFETYGCSNVRMVLPNLSDELSHIIASENGDSL